ncbi:MULTISPECIES: RluA family pseudouridine synthase [unclassified Polaribacter]|jgi:23S rRNA pseudouridine1911/1915/1917 synthase|uniref:RluA family pseudouridine synthase n=1 Tax=unclassified Polaribacter TaxID=196858 RepID=UPI00052D0EBB|nr:MULTISPECIES: RluA family pseudouridine synthase [unclassified Polaribacter]KGL60500.1 RNA pseudouridylate synthase [Polaribacter sp. Hel1_33_49]PKV65202.1 23S rRNA pseudouridine1911/1915/1917 synthase [Polaribacter sp. Hel1_33_96]
MQLAETHIVEKLEKSIRFQEYGVGIFNTIPTKSGIKKAIKKELIFIDGLLATTSKFISGGEKIELFESENSSTFERLKLDLEVLFEDSYLAIIYKPAGILVSGNRFVTIANGLTQNLKKSNQLDAVRPQPIHRLDYPTSGLLLIGKTSSSINALSALFKNNEIQKTYFAITIGKMEENGEMNFHIDEKIALTQFDVLRTVVSKRFTFLNLVKLSPKTGRKHQLRKHLSSIGNPILGDKEYFKEGLVLNGRGLYLHASALDFIHPFTKDTISITKENPKKFTTIFPDF